MASKYNLKQLMQGEAERRALMSPAQREEEDKIAREWDRAAPVGKEFGSGKLKKRSQRSDL